MTILHIAIANDTLKFYVNSLFQLAIAVGAWLVALAIHRGSAAKQNEDLRIKLYDKRYNIYLAFKEFVDQCFVQDVPDSHTINEFINSTERIDFLFGKEILLYQKEIMANAIAIVGITSGAPCASPPIVGSIVGYFPGSSLLTDIEDIRKWFYIQKFEHLEQYFRPYLDFCKAGINISEIRMKPPILPQPIPVRRPVGLKRK